MKRRTFLASMLAVAATLPVRASGPVPHTTTGCVRNGQFSTQRGTTTYTYKVRVDGPNKPFDLTPYEGKRILISGNLLPGDYFYPTAPVQILGKCR